MGSFISEGFSQEKFERNMIYLERKRTIKVVWCINLIVLYYIRGVHRSIRFDFMYY